MKHRQPDPYNFDSLTPAQQWTLGKIAINEDQFHHPRTLKVLIDRGLIHEHEEQHPGALGMLKVKRYGMDIATHMAWCYWCSAKLKEEEANR
jgi:hypothetical protein